MPEPVAQYSRATITLHWLTAAGLVLSVALGWRLADAGGSERAAVLAWHMSAGIAILLLGIARVGTRLLTRRPAPVGSRLEQHAASMVHAAFYVALLLIPLLGWLAISAASGAPGRIFGFLPLPALPAVAGSSGVAAFAEGAHRWLAYGLCGLVLVHVAAAIKHQASHPAEGFTRILPGAQGRWGWHLAGFAAVFLLLFSFGNGFADSWLPGALRISGKPEALPYAAIDPRRAHVFATVQPILEEKCASCHGVSAQKGGLRLDEFTALMRGGEGGKVVVPGKVDDSVLVQRILLPAAHKYAMPPVGKAPLTPAESQLVMWWISAGADDSTTIVGANPPPLVQTILQNLGLSAESPVFKQPVAMPSTETLTRLRSSFEVQFLFRGQGFLQAQPRFDQKHSQALQIETLTAVAEQLVRLDLSGGNVSVAQFSSLANLRNLQRLNLANTPADDASVSQLQGLPNLEVLNLYGTKVTDAALDAVRQMPSLMTVYLSGTAVSSEAVSRLREAQPGLKVVWEPAGTG